MSEGDWQHVERVIRDLKTTDTRFQSSNLIHLNPMWRRHFFWWSSVRDSRTVNDE